MKKIYLSVLGLVGLMMSGWSQNPGMIISEFLQNPDGLDSPFEYVELVATQAIDFSVNPYTIITCSNGTGTTDGWIRGGTTTYAFEITSGTVAVGDVVYVGGSSMAPTGTILRSIDYSVDGGDGGIGNATGVGVMGNGTGNADGIAVFNVGVASITSSTVPTDAVFYGSAIGGAEVSPTEGYELPDNDLYDGGKVVAASPFIVDADLTVATGGEFNAETNEFTVARTFESGAATDGVTAITIIAPEPEPAVFSFVEEDVTVNEDAGSVSLEVELTGANGSESSMDVTIIGSSSTADSPDDYTLTDVTITFDGTADGTASFTIDIEDDLLEEQSEYIILTMSNLENAEEGENTQMFLYITDNDRVLPTATNELKLELLTSFSTGVEGDNSAEIVAFDSTQNYLFVANSEANQVDVIDFNDPSAPILVDAIAFDSVGGINSVAVYNDLLAVAVEAPVKQDPGFISLWNVDGTFLKRLTVAALPDMVTFNHAGDQLIIACEGEPNDDYTVDPNGAVAIIELNETITDLTGDDVTILDFTAFDAMEEDLIDDGVRIFGPDASVSQDLEPEYVTVLDDDATAYVVLQENNAIAVVDLEAQEITEILALGTIDHSLFGFGLDASNRTSGINIANFPIAGMFMPDAIANISVGGTNYLITANEGDSRDYDGYSEEVRVDDLDLDETVYPDADYIQNDRLLGRLKTTTATGDTDGDGDIDLIHSYGTRSFTIWDAETGDRIFDSGDMIEQIIANHPEYVDIFNAHNENGDAEAKNRSDDKGPEPEGVTTALIDGNAFVFVSLERVGGVMVFNINDPANPEYIGYHNNRDAETNGPDRGAEGMIFIDAEMSPNGNGILILANEVSSTLSIYGVNSCQSLSELEIVTTDDATGFCEGGSLEITAEGVEGLAFEWSFDGELIEDEEGDTYVASEAGFYQVSFVNDEEDCMGTTDSLIVVMNELPEVTAEASEELICFGEEVTFTSTGAEEYVWDVEGVVNDEPYTPETAGLVTYTVTGTDENGCENTAAVDVEMAEEITGEVTTEDDLTAFCEGESLEISVETEEGIAIQWLMDGDEIDGATEDSYVITEAGTYQVNLSNDETECDITTEEMIIDINELPEVTASASQDSICFGEEVTFTSAGADELVWDVDGVVNDIAYEPETAGLVTYTVTGTDENGCENTASVDVEMAEEITITSTTEDEILGDDGEIDITVAGGFGDYTFDWDNDGTGDFDDDEDLTGLEAGAYIVVVEDEFGCQGTETVTVNSQVGLTENGELIMAIYPNPTTGFIQVVLNSNEAQTLQVINIAGAVVYSNVTVTNTQNIDLTYLTPGVYFVQVSVGDTVQSQKLIVQ